MKKAYIPVLVVLSLALLAVFHYFGNHFFLYVRISGYDVFMHILGGFSISLAIYWVMRLFYGSTEPLNRDFWITVILTTLVCGVLWEAVENVNDIAGAPLWTKAYYIDTAKDIIDDVIGSLITLYFFRETNKAV